jgi:hypothetical protein
MRRLIRDERGEFTLAQMLIASAMMLAVLGGTLMVFSSAEKLNLAANRRVDAEDQARSALDRIAAQLRNLASPTADQPQAVDAAGPYDLVFQTVDRVGPNSGLNASNVMRVRYCLGTTNTTTLYRQEQRWTTQATPAAPATTTCPSAASGWTTGKVVVLWVANTRSGLNRPIFDYNTATVSDITQVHAQLYIDRDTARLPPETVLSTGVFLRNQNRHPVAAFTADTTVRGKVILNGADSSDPEGDPLSYVWFDAGTKVGEGIRFDYTVTPGTSHALQLKVFDLAGLEGDSTTQTVVMQA